MLSQSVALCRGLRSCGVRKLTGAFVAGVLASAAFVQAAVAGDVAKSDGTPIDPKTWTGFGWGLGIAADFASAVSGSAMPYSMQMVLCASPTPPVMSE